MHWLTQMMPRPPDLQPVVADVIVRHDVEVGRVDHVPGPVAGRFAFVGPTDEGGHVRLEAIAYVGDIYEGMDALDGHVDKHAPELEAVEPMVERRRPASAQGRVHAPGPGFGRDMPTLARAHAAVRGDDMDRQDIAYPSVVDDLAGPHVRRVEQEIFVNLEDRPRLFGRLGHQVVLGQRPRRRLFDAYVLARPKRGHSLLGVKVVRRQDFHGVDGGSESMSSSSA